MEIRLATPDDYAVVGDLMLSAYVGDGHVDSGRSYVARLQDTATRAAQAEVWVAVDGDLVAGAVTYCPDGSSWREVAGDGEGEFRMLAVSTQARGGGVGQALVQHCLDRSRADGHRAMVLCSLPGQQAAHRVYERLGFVREPARDWSPDEGITLWAFRLDY